MDIPRQKIPIPDKNLLLFGICLLFVLFASAWSQNSPPTAQNFHQWGSVTLFNGLPSDSVHAIAQTRDGVMWFGTDNGLARFDGRRVQTISLPDKNSNKILALQLSADGSLWIGTEHGAARYLDSKFQEIEGTENLSITSILLDENTMLATADGVLLKVSASENGSLNAEKVPDNELTGSNGQTLRFTDLIRDGERVIAGTEQPNLSRRISVRIFPEK